MDTEAVKEEAKQLEAWHGEFCRQSIDQDRDEKSSTNDNRDRKAADASQDKQQTPSSDGLRSARIYIKSHASTLFQSKERLDHILKCLLHLPASQPSQASSNVIEAPPSSSTPSSSLKHIEWNVVLFLELLVRSEKNKLLLMQRFAKNIQRVQKQTKAKKRKRNATIVSSSSSSSSNSKGGDAQHEEVYLQFLIQQLTRVVFLLPSNDPFSAFLQEKCLTSYMYKKIPEMVKSLYDFFEVENPHLPKSTIEEESNMTDMKTIKKKKAKRSLNKVTPQSAAPPPKRKLTLKKDTKRLNHFHGMMSDVAKLLDAEPTCIPSKAKKLAAAAAKNPPKGAASVSKNMPNATSVITLHHSQHATRADREQAHQTKKSLKAQGRKDTVNHRPNKAVSLENGSPTLSPVPTRSSHQSVVTETPAKLSGISETPFRDMHVGVEETPCSKRYSGDASGVAETPGGCSDHGPNFSLEETPTEPDGSDHPEAVKPLKLFGAISKKKSNISLPLLHDESGTDMENPSLSKARPTSVAIAAARSFLRRKSL